MKNMNTPEHNTQPDPKPKNMTFGEWVFWGIASLLVVGFFLVLPLWCLLDYLGEQRLDHFDPAGELVAVLPVGRWNPDALIETTTGFYTVDGSVALARGTKFQLETRDNGARFLCNVDGKYCGRIVGQGLEDAPKGPAAAGSAK